MKRNRYSEKGQNHEGEGSQKTEVRRWGTKKKGRREDKRETMCKWLKY